MQNATHYIEIFKSKDKQIQGPMNEIKMLPGALKLTASSNDLKTIAVWKIKLKPGVKIQTNE